MLLCGGSPTSVFSCWMRSRLCSSFWLTKHIWFWGQNWFPLAHSRYMHMHVCLRVCMHVHMCFHVCIHARVCQPPSNFLISAQMQHPSYQKTLLIQDAAQSSLSPSSQNQESNEQWQCHKNKWRDLTGKWLTYTMLLHQGSSCSPNSSLTGATLS